MVAGSDVPIFLEPVYYGRVEENVVPPVLVVDVDTVEENVGRNVYYYWVDNQYGGKEIYVESTN